VVSPDIEGVHLVHPLKYRMLQQGDSFTLLILGVGGAYYTNPARKMDEHGMSVPCYRPFSGPRHLADRSGTFPVYHVTPMTTVFVDTTTFLDRSREASGWTGF
jgi:hypothetical protein